ncbi:MAG: HEPN domain-containing protein [Chloroflexi bacterium]|nr:HEPN domain-containing protein [Chloroflexota bacterium]
MAESDGMPRARLEKADRFLRTAQLALRDGDDEGCVSRAYYAVFHSAVALLEGQVGGSRIRGYRPLSHLEVLRRCAEWNQRYTRLNAAGLLRGQRDLHTSLRRLHDWREQADYDLGKTE